MPVRRRAPRRLDIPRPSFIEEVDLMVDPETPLDPDKWERWTCPRSAPRPWSYREGVVKALEERDFACPALGFDPDPEVARLAAAILAREADDQADQFLYGPVGFGTGIPTDPADLAAWRAEKAAVYRSRAEFWRARLDDIVHQGSEVS